MEKLNFPKPSSKTVKATVFIVLVFFPFFFSLVPKASASITIVSGYRISIGNGHFVTMGKDITFETPLTYDNGLVAGDGLWINSTADITLACWHENGWLNYTCSTASSTQQIYNGTKPDRIYLGGSQAAEGGVWTYSALTKIITISVPLPPTLPFSIQIAWTPLPTIPPTYVPPLAAVTGSGLIIRPGVVLKTSSNNAKLDFSVDTSLYKVEINSTVFWLDQQYHAKHYTRYCIWILTPNNVNLTINSWFPTGNSSARITIGTPLATPIAIGFSSPNLKDQPQAAYAVCANGKAIGQIYDRTTQTLNFLVTTTDDSAFLIYATVGETAYDRPPENVDVGITNMEGCGNWVFSQYKFYNFTAKFWDGDGYADIALAQVAFTDGVYWVNLTYNGQYQSVSSGIDVVELKQGSVTILDANEIEVLWRVYFKNTILDADNIDLYMKVTDGSGISDNWQLVSPNYFRIYNLGGHTTLSARGNAGRMIGGDAFDLQANETFDHYDPLFGNVYFSDVNVSMLFRDLQHVKLLPMIICHIDEHYGWFTLTYGIDYCVNDVWIEGWQIVLTNYNSSLTGDEVYRTYFLELINRGTIVKVMNVSTFCTAYPDSNSRMSQVWFDLWFNRANASSIIGARMNAYCYPMLNDASYWIRWFTGNNWGPNLMRTKEASLFAPLLDQNDQTLHTQQIKMVRLNCRLTLSGVNFNSSSLADNWVQVYNYNEFDLTIGTEPFQGIDTPPWDETHIPSMSQGGLLGALWDAIKWAVGTLVTVFQFDTFLRWRGFVNIMDAIFGYFGYPNLMTVISNWLASAFQWMITSITYLLTILASIFQLLGDIMGSLIWTITTAFTVFSTMWKDLVSIFTGTVGTGQELWFAFNMPAWITLAIILYPVFLVYIWEEEGIKGLQDHLTFMYNMFMWLVNFLLTIVEYAWAGIARLIEAIPGVE